jgi:hypothetical protein
MLARGTDESGQSTLSGSLTCPCGYTGIVLLNKSSLYGWGIGDAGGFIHNEIEYGRGQIQLICQKCSNPDPVYEMSRK